MSVSTELRRSIERPGALELAIREWQRQLMEMAKSAQHRAPAAPAADDSWWSEEDQFDAA